MYYQAMAPPIGFIPWNKGLKGIHLSPATEFKKGIRHSPETEFKKGNKPISPIKKDQHVAPETEFKKGHSTWNKGKSHLPDEKHSQWKGDGVGDGALHSWIHRKLGKANRCERIGCKYPRTNAAKQTLRQPKTFQWANISHKYKREFSDWIQLCASCHARYDRGLIEL